MHVVSVLCVCHLSVGKPPSGAAPTQSQGDGSLKSQTGPGPCRSCTTSTRGSAEREKRDVARQHMVIKENLNKNKIQICSSSFNTNQKRISSEFSKFCIVCSSELQLVVALQLPRLIRHSCKNQCCLVSKYIRHPETLQTESIICFSDRHTPTHSCTHLLTPVRK